MKKLIVCILALMLVGCNQETKESYYTCKATTDSDGIKYNVDSRLYYLDDVVYRNVTVEEYEFSTEEKKAEYLEMMGLMRDMMASANVDYQYEEDELKINVIKTVDYDTVDIGLLVQIDPNEDAMMNASKTNIDLKRSIMVYESAGRTCEE